MIRGYRLLIGVGAVLLLVGAAAAALLTELAPPRAVAPAVAIGGPFTLTNGAGGTVTDRTYRGKWLLVYFGYTFCPDACPTTLNTISTALDQLGPLADRLQPLFITVDPRRDTPKVMADYVKAFNPRLVGLTGSADQIAAVAKEYHVYVSAHTQDGPNYLVDHSSFIYVMDPEGRFVTTLPGSAPSAQLAERLKQLVSQTS